MDRANATRTFFSIVLGAFLVLTAVVVLPGAQAVSVAAPQPIPNSPLVSVAVTFDDPDLTQLDGLYLHFSCDMTNGDFSEFLDVDLPGDLAAIRTTRPGTDHATLLDVLNGAAGGFGYGYDAETGGYGYLIPGYGDVTTIGYGYLQTGQSGYGYVGGEHGASTGYTDPLASGYGTGYGGYGYGYGYDSGTLTFVFEMVQPAFDANEECTLVVEVVPVGHPSGSFEGPRSDPFTPRVPPTADAGEDFDVAANQEGVALDGSLSFDGNNGPGELTFLWEQVGGPTVALDGADTAEPTFTAPAASGTLTFRLTVNDTLDPGTDPVDVTVKNVLADAGDDRYGTEGRTVTLDGSGSSSDAGPLAYAWEQLTGPAVTLNNAGTVAPSFQVPDVSADMPATFRLTVTAAPYTDSDDVVITFIEQEPPTVVAPADATVIEGQEFVLGATARDRNDDPLTYKWTVVSGPPGAFNSSTVLNPIFTPPEVDSQETVVLRINATDGLGYDVDEVTYVVRDNEAPIARAGIDALVTTDILAVALQLDGRLSSDPDGDALSFSWSIESAPAGVTLGGTAALAQPTLTVPPGTQGGIAAVVLTVTDPYGAVGQDRAEVLVLARPVLDANAGPDLGVNTGSLVTLDGEASTGATSFQWTAVTPGAPQLAVANQLRATFTAPATPTPAEQPWVYRLTVGDGTSTDTDDVEVRVYDGDAPTGAEAWYLHTTGCTLADAGLLVPSTPANTVSTDADSPTDTEFCLRPTAPVAADRVLDFKGTMARTVPDGTTIRGSVYVALLVPDEESDAPVLLDGVRVDVGIAQGGEAIGGATERTSSALLGLLDDLPDVAPHFTEVPFEFTLTEDLAANTPFAFQVHVEPTAGLVYLVGLDGDHESYFELPPTGGVLPGGSPVAEAGPALRAADEGTTVTLDGSASQAGSGTPTQYFWSQYAGPRVTLSGSGATPSFLAPQVRADTNLRFRLVVANSDGLTSLPDRLTVTIKDVPPTLAAPSLALGITGGSAFVDEGSLVRLTADVEDSPMDFVQARWTQPQGIPVGGILQGLDRVFVAPNVAQDTVLRFTLTARDNEGLVASASLQLTVNALGNGGGTGPGGVIILPPQGPTVDDTIVPIPPTTLPPLPPATTPTTPTNPPAADPDVDTDGDGVPDRIERLLGTDPLKASSVPSFDISHQLIVRRLGDANGLGWQGHPAAIGYQLWSSNSPYTLLDTIDDADRHSYTDVDGKLTTKYKLTFFVERTAAGGYLADASGLATLSGWDESGASTPIGTSSAGGQPQRTAPQGLPDWAWGAFVLGGAAILCAFAVALFAVRRK